MRHDAPSFLYTAVRVLDDLSHLPPAAYVLNDGPFLNQKNIETFEYRIH